jgi:hypothetical protein
MENDKRYYYIPKHNINRFFQLRVQYEEVKGVMGYDRDKELLHRTYSRCQIGDQGGLTKTVPAPGDNPQGLGPKR